MLRILVVVKVQSFISWGLSTGIRFTRATLSQWRPKHHFSWHHRISWNSHANLFSKSLSLVAFCSCAFQTWWKARSKQQPSPKWFSRRENSTIWSPWTWSMKLWIFQICGHSLILPLRLGLTNHISSLAWLSRLRTAKSKSTFDAFGCHGKLPHGAKLSY